MEIVSFKVSQYRSISGEISSDNFNGLTIVGQNNSGKTNLLKAMRVFFEGKFNSDLYDYEKDKPHGVKQGQTSFAVRFTFSESEINDVSEDLSQDDDDDDDDSVIDLGVLGEQEELGDSISLDDGGTKQQETKPTQSRGRKLRKVRTSS